MLFLLLQKSNQTSESENHIEYLKQHLLLWWESILNMLVIEVCFIQSKLIYHGTTVALEKISKMFNNFMIVRKINTALENSFLGYFQQIIKPNIDLLKEKHSMV